jgi:hypothetical protein
MNGRLLSWGGDPGKHFRGDYAGLPPDARTVASGEAVFDTRTGTQRNLEVSPVGTYRPVFSSDSRLFVTTSGSIRLLEVATGQVLAELPPWTASVVQATPSHDGRRVAFFAANKITVWDIAATKVIAEYRVDGYGSSRSFALTGGMAFSPDGRHLAAGYSDGTVLLWAMPPFPSETKLSKADFATLWNDLGIESPADAYSAVWRLAGQPSAAIALLREKYPLVPAALPEEWNKLVAALDSPKFADREAASKRLRELGRSAFGPLRQALKNKPSAEQSRRIDAILAELSPPAAPSGREDRRAIRAVAVLEYAATDDAYRLLGDWAERGPTPRLAFEAAQAFERTRLRR